ncbi:hypothetical protein LCGC14_0954440 [marine sediment metagenome]|uniref:Uncharacterized protein n=1 Tax=marine sediment metagenome TaxID=412755 RepID=A0A0F9NKV8_9ZZZZ
MAVKVKCKGTVFAQDLAGVAYVTMAQVIDIDLPDMEMETFESDTLNNANAGIEHSPTGRTEGGSFSANVFYDPADASHTEWLGYLSTTGLLSAMIVKCQVTFADTGTSTWTFTCAGISAGGTVALNDGLKMSISGKLDGIPVFA